MLRALGAVTAAIVGSCTLLQAQTPVDSFNPGANNSVRAVALQPDGRILVGGTFTKIGGGGFGATTRNRIARLNTDGSVDNTFNPGANNDVIAFAVQPDGKIVVSGLFTTMGGGGTGTTTRNRIARLNSDGSLDTSFNPGANSAVQALALQPDGKILVGGSFTTLGGGGTGATFRNFIGRLNADGSVDTGFNPGADGSIDTIAVQSDGNILLGGTFFRLGGGTGTTSRTFFGRVTGAGAVDAFAPDPNTSVSAIVLLPDGRIVVGGAFTRFGTLSSGVTRRRLARLSATGVVDTAFDPGTTGNVYALALQTDGKIVVGGSFSGVGGGTGTTTRNDLARINSDGSVDSGFDPGANGILGIDRVVLQPDGKIIVTGDFTMLGGGSSGTTARSYIGRLDTGTGSPAAAPTITTVAPSSGPVAGGTAITITGTGFQAGATVSIGGVAATSIVVSGATTITAVTGAHAAGVVDVIVSNPDLGTVTKAAGFTYTQSSLPGVSLDRASLAFAVATTGVATSGPFVGTITPPQNVRLAQTGAGVVSWTAKSNQPWLLISPGSGTVPGGFKVTASVEDGLPPGNSASGTITVTLTGASATSIAVAVTLTIVSGNDSPPPIGTVDTPVEGSVLAGSVAVTGWSLDNIGVKRVEIWRDLQPGEPTPTFSSPGDPRNGQIFIANATFVDGARPDVEGLYVSMPFAYRAGWGYLMLTWGLYNSGNGVYKLYAYSFDLEDHITTLGAKSVTFSNNAATKPFGSVDTPGIGGDAGTSPNFGWALTPKVNGTATCKIQSNGVQVSIDSGPLQPVVYGDARSDLAGAFPGFSNSAAAGGHFLFDWSTLTNGPHTIGWLVTDDCNRADGVGSRYFNVTNGTSLLAAPAQAPAGGLRVAETESSEPITVAYGFGELPQIVEAGLAGSRTIEVRQGERVELRTPRGYEVVYQIAGGQVRGLPIGSTWDAASGTFSWQPAPAFLGRYRIIFSNGRERISVRVVVVP
jgi:uncharacterized delta-60 repeat protein